MIRSLLCFSCQLKVILQCLFVIDINSSESVLGRDADDDHEEDNDDEDDDEDDYKDDYKDDEDDYKMLESVLWAGRSF